MVMKLYSENRYSRVMVFIDYRNIIDASITNIKYVNLDFLSLTKMLVGSRELIGAYIFDGCMSTPSPETRNHYEKLRLQGFRVVVRDSVERLEGGVKPVQKEVDVALACELLEHAMMNHYDVAIVVSGDRDFVPAMQKVQAAGKRVEVASFSGTYSPQSKNTADVYYELDGMPIMSMYTMGDNDAY